MDGTYDGDVMADVDDPSREWTPAGGLLLLEVTNGCFDLCEGASIFANGVVVGIREHHCCSGRREMDAVEREGEGYIGRLRDRDRFLPLDLHLADSRADGLDTDAAVAGSVCPRTISQFGRAL